MRKAMTNQKGWCSRSTDDSKVIILPGFPKLFIQRWMKTRMKMVRPVILCNSQGQPPPVRVALPAYNLSIKEPGFFFIYYFSMQLCFKESG